MTVQLNVADQIRAWRGGYWHHAIYLGNGYVAHYTDVRANKHRASVRVGTLAEFAQGQLVENVGYRVCSAPEVVLARVHSRIGEARYNVVFNNCEHFAVWCKTGVGRSEQVRRAGAAASGVIGHAATTATAVSAVTATGTALGLSGGAGLMSGLGALGSAVGLGAAGGICVVAAAPAVLANVVLGRAMRDDARIGDDECVARRHARRAGKVASVAGTVSSVGLVSMVGVPGLSAAGITTGLAGIGSLVGGGMVAGLAVVGVVPALACAGAAAIAYISRRKRYRSN